MVFSSYFARLPSDGELGEIHADSLNVIVSGRRVHKLSHLLAQAGNAE